MVPVARPRRLELERIGDPSIGYLTVQSLARGFPFEVRRVFWTFTTPPDVTRGRHAHHETEMVLLALSGEIKVSTELPDELPELFMLESPNEGLYLPPLCWRTMSYSPGAVQLVFASTEYSADDYIRDYDEFRRMRKS